MENNGGDMLVEGEGWMGKRRGRGDCDVSSDDGWLWWLSVILCIGRVVCVLAGHISATPACCYLGAYALETSGSDV